MTSPILRAEAQQCCGGGGVPGDCPDGQECLPSDYISPDDCPAGGITQPCVLSLGEGATSGGYGTAPFVVNADAPPAASTLLVLVAYETAGTDTHPAITCLDSQGRTWTSEVQAQGPDQFGLGAAIFSADLEANTDPFTVTVEADASTDIGSWRVRVLAATCTSGIGSTDSVVGVKADGTIDLAPALTGAASLVVGLIASDQDDPPSSNIVTAHGTQLFQSDPSFVFTVAVSDDTLQWDVTAQQWDNDVALAIELLAADECCQCAADCACGAADYQPYCISVNAADADAHILSLSPFAYYFMDSATGGTDQTGNGHTATASHGTVTYGVAAISAKNQQGEATALTAGGSVTFPPPVADMSAPSSTWSAAMLMQVDAYNNGGVSSLDGGYPFFSWAGSSPPKMGHTIGQTGRLWHWTDSTFGPLGSIAGTPDVMFAIGEPHVYIVIGYSDGTTEHWLDGVLVLACCRTGAGIDGTAFMVGRMDNGGPFFGAIDMTFSNLATWSRVLTRAEIKSVSEALMDATIIANGWVPA